MRPPPTLRACALAAALWGAVSPGCAARRPAPSSAAERDDDPRSVLERFAAALDGARFEEAYSLLSARWRARSTPARLRSDLAASGAAGRDAVERVRALLARGAALSVGEDRATLSVADGKAARLLREGGSWRVDALE